jgi:hypothetical protein
MAGLFESSLVTLIGIARWSAEERDWEILILEGWDAINLDARAVMGWGKWVGQGIASFPTGWRCASRHV